MAKLMGIYKCGICGNMVEAVHEGKGDLVCCGEQMELLQENITDASREKHVPVIEKTDNGIKVKVGSAPHPMEDAHYIEWIEIITGQKSCRVFLKPGQPAEAEFPIEPANDLIVRAYCNIHGLWKA